ncbi:MAG: sensor histidine kinase [Sedimentisphaerales bacterium]|nr:sensor histidine kinase [Sedimentisphaerales bacterium]
MLDINEVKQAEDALRSGRDELEVKIKERTSELEKLNRKMMQEIKSREEAQAKLLVYRDQLRSLASELSLAEERTRRRIANNVHDNIGQNLAMAKIKLQLLAETTGSSEQKKQVQEIANLVADTIESIRSLTVEISPPVLYELGFEPAVEWLLRQVRKKYGLKTDFSSDFGGKPIDENISVFLFQAVRELLNNVTMHAQANIIKISACRLKNQIQVTVSDDGKGFKRRKIGAIQESLSNFGLFSIRERLNYIGGKLEINSACGKGTEVIITAPLSVNKQK